MSPTVSLEASIVTLLIAAYEHLDVAIFDAPWAYLHTLLPNNKTVIMVIRNDFIDIMCDINPEYRKYVVHLKNKKRVLYLKVLCVVYRCIKSALCWYNIYSKTLKNEGFVISSYDRFIENKVSNGIQYAIVWYMHDHTLLHTDPKVVDKVLNIMEKYFGKVSHEIENTWLLTDGNTYHQGKIDRNIYEKKIEETFEIFSEVLEGSISSPATKTLMIVDEQATQLDYKKSEITHLVVMKLLFIITWTMPYCETLHSFLTTGVSISDEDDRENWGGL